MDKENDVVILKADGISLPIVQIQNVEKTSVGEKIYVISSPSGLENSISDGILSGIRQISPRRKLLQITAPISPGSSGGPVFNGKGEVIGIATAILRDAQNLNFAVPADIIKSYITSKRVVPLKDAKISNYTETAEYLFMLGTEYTKAFLYKKALESFTQAIRLDPDYAGAYGGRGAVYALIGNKKQAINDFTKEIKLSPNFADAYYIRGFTYAKSGNNQKAISDYTKAIELNPRYVDAYYGRSFAYGTVGNHGEAINDLTKAIEIVPDNANYYYLRGLQYYIAGNYSQAVSDYKIAARLGHKDAQDSLSKEGIQW